MLLISACLLGAKVKYNGSSNYCTLLAKYKDCGLFIPICPECLGQLTIPRLPAEITGGDGSDVLNGTAKVYDNAKVFGNAKIYGNALVYGDAKVFGDEEV